MPENIIYSESPEDFFYMGENVPCQNACPALTNIPAYIRCLFEKRYERSYEINQMANILPGILGRICSRPCEDKCRHGESELGEPVNICHIKRAASDFSASKTRSAQSTKVLRGNIAIIGAGPAGLAAAHDLAALGFSVTVYEAMDQPGGMLRYGIPEFRLPRQILKYEIDAILQSGIKMKTGVRVGRDINIADLLANHHAVLLAVGCYRPIALDVPNENLPGVHSGLDFMMDVCSGTSPGLGKHVLVIGAGFTAFDCARTALRLGAKDVSICLRRTEEDLHITHDEILETKKEGIQIRSLMLCRQILGQTHVEGVEFVRTFPEGLQSNGKSKISPIDGSEFVINADTVIVATGQMQGPLLINGKRDANGNLTVDKDTFRTSIDNLFATGDYMTGPSTVIDAIAMGRKSAQKIAEHISGKSLFKMSVRFEDYKITDRKRVWDFLPRQTMPTVNPVSNRFQSLRTEVESGYTTDLAHEEAKRCYLCYLHYEINIDKCIYCRYCIDVAPRDCIKLVNKVKINSQGAISDFEETTIWKDVNAIIIDNSRCIRCGECVRVCPVDCISVTKAELISIKDID